MVHEGGCLCRAVRYRAEGEPINVRVCHCTLCQKAMSSPFYARAFFARDAVTIEGPIEKYPTSEHIWRVFCPECGVRLATERNNGTGIGIALASFDDPHAFTPTEHIFTSSMVPWLKLADGLPQHPERPPE